MGRKLGKDGNGNWGLKGGMGIFVSYGILIPWNRKLPNIIKGVEKYFCQVNQSTFEAPNFQYIKLYITVSYDLLRLVK